MLVKNPLRGPSAAIKEGLYYGKSDCVIVYPADDFLNINIIDKMYDAFSLNNNDIVVASRFIATGGWPKKMLDSPRWYSQFFQQVC